jgi:hypothetical protein
MLLTIHKKSLFYYKLWIYILQEFHMRSNTAFFLALLLKRSMSFRYRDLISCDANHRISRWDWLGSRWLLPLSLAGFLVTWGQEAAGAMIYEASFCSPNCKTETDFETTITFSGLPQSFTSDGTNFVQSFAGSFTVNPVGSPLKNGTITNLQYIADANHDKFDGITSNGPYLFLRGLNEDTKEGAELYFAFRLSVPLAQASPTVAFFPNTNGDNPSDGKIIANTSYLCRETPKGDEGYDGPQDCKSGGDYFGLQTGDNDLIRVPGPLPLLGLGGVIVWSRKLKSRCSRSTPIANQQNNQPG